MRSAWDAVVRYLWDVTTCFCATSWRHTTETSSRRTIKTFLSSSFGTSLRRRGDVTMVRHCYVLLRCCHDVPCVIWTNRKSWFSKATRTSFGVSAAVERAWKLARLTFSLFKRRVPDQNTAYLAFSWKCNKKKQIWLPEEITRNL